jgi:crossover junction endodeoxyribonuclease RusA
LSLNHRRNRWSHARIVKQVRRDVCYLAKSHQLHVGGPWPHVTVRLHFAPHDRRRRDEDNLVATQKVCADALVDAGVVVDDDPQHMTKHMPRLHPRTGEGGRMWLAVEIHQADEVAS